MAVQWKMIGAIAIAAIALIVAAAYIYAASSPLKISSEEARQRIARGDVNVVLDVRTDPEWALGHYSGAIHIPAADLVKQAPEIISKSARIVVYCNTGQRARRAAEQLERMGYNNVRYITGGYWTLEAALASASSF